MIREGIQRHVAHDPDLGRRLLHRLHSARDQAEGVGSLRAAEVLLLGVDMGEDSDGRDAEGAGLDRRAGRFRHRQPVDAGHGRDRDARRLPIVHHQGPDQVGRLQARLARQAADPIGLAKAARPEGRVGGDRGLGHEGVRETVRKGCGPCRGAMQAYDPGGGLSPPSRVVIWSVVAVDENFL